MAKRIYLRSKVKKVAENADFLMIDGERTMILKEGVRLHKGQRNRNRSKRWAVKYKVARRFKNLG